MDTPESTDQAQDTAEEQEPAVDRDQQQENEAADAEDPTLGGSSDGDT